MSSPALKTLFPEDDDGPEAGRSELQRPAAGRRPRARGLLPRPPRADEPAPAASRRTRSGAFTRAERAVWACRYPEEVPTVNGEFEWLRARVRRPGLTS